jgi:hypothetical protein
MEPTLSPKTTTCTMSSPREENSAEASSSEATSPMPSPPQPQQLTPSPLSLPVIIQRCLELKVAGQEETTENDADSGIVASSSSEVPPTTISTDIVLQRFADRTMFLISQMNGRIGSYMTCHMEYSMIDGSTTYSVQVLMGKRDDAIVEVMARQIHERIFKFESESPDGTEPTGITSIPPLLLGITLHRNHGYSRESFQQIVDAAVQMYKESCGGAGP